MVYVLRPRIAGWIAQLGYGNDRDRAEAAWQLGHLARNNAASQAAIAGAGGREALEALARDGSGYAREVLKLIPASCFSSCFSSCFPAPSSPVQPPPAVAAAPVVAAPQLTRRRAKAAAALQEDGFALHPLDENEDRRTWKTLELCLQTKDPSQLGKGKDVTRAYGEYNELHLASAWSIEHPRAKQRYDVARELVLEDLELLDRRSVHSLGAQPKGLPVATAPAAASFALTPAASEALLLHGTSAAKLLSVLANGLNERYSGSSAGTAFGDGVYLAEDVAKTDQYAAPDAKYDGSSDLHRRLYGDSNRHQGSVF